MTHLLRKARRARLQILQATRDQLAGLVRQIKRIDQHPRCQPSVTLLSEAQYERRFGRGPL